MRQVVRSAEGSAPRWRTVVFLAACLLYFRYRLDPQLLHDSGTIVRLAVFGLDPLWLRDQLALPAGPLVLGCNWLVQWYYLPWVGPWVMLASVVCLMAVTQGFADSLVGRRVAGVRFLPALLAVVLYNSQHHQLVVVLAVAVAGLAALGYVRLPDSLGQRGMYLLLALPSLLVVAAGAYLILLACVVCVECRSERRRLLALLAIVYGEALPWLLTILRYDRPIASAYLDLLPISKIDTVIALAVVILWTLLPLLAIGLPRIAGRPVRARAWGWPGLALGLALAAGLGYDPSLHELLVFNQAYQQQDWPRVVTLAEALPPPRQGPFVAYAYVRAKYETGRLPEDLLRVRQSRYSLFQNANPRDGLTVTTLRSRSYLLLGDLTLQLGSLNEAERDAIEAIEIYGPVPEAIEQLAKVNLVKGRVEAAEVLLRHLAQVPARRPTARALLALAEDSPTTAEAGASCAVPALDAACPVPAEPADPLVAPLAAELDRLRSVAQKFDRQELLYRFPAAAHDLLRSNPANRMAFEYLLTCALLDARPDAAVSEFDRLAGLGYRRMPTLYQEAALVLEALRGVAVDLAGYAIEPDVREQFEQFLKACNIDADELGALTQRGYNPSPELRQRFGHRYYYYFVFNDSGAGR